MSESRLDFPRKKRPVFVRVPREFSSTSRRKHTRSKWPQYSINSSARPVFGTLRPSAFAVFRLMYNSTLVTCWTGRSAGCGPPFPHHSISLVAAGASGFLTLIQFGERPER
jgi:hypothetical protein